MRNNFFLLRTAVFFIWIIIFSLSLSFGQNSNQNEKIIIAYENDTTKSDSQKLHEFYLLKIQFDERHVPHDSIYALLMHKIGAYESFVNEDYHTALKFTLDALQINTCGKKNCSPFFATKNYFNIAFYYFKLLLYQKSLTYFDSTIIFVNRIENAPGIQELKELANVYKANIFFKMGDYQKDIDICTIGLADCFHKNDSANYLSFLNQREQAFFFQNKLQYALADVNSAIILAKQLRDPYNLASAYKMQGYIYRSKRDFFLAINSFQNAIKERIIYKDWAQVAGDYNDFGNFFKDSLKDFSKASVYYFKGINYGVKKKDSLVQARIYCNLGDLLFQEKNFSQSQFYYKTALNFLKLAHGDFFTNSPSFATNLIGNKELLISIFKGKTELLLNQYKQNHSQNYLTACLQTALVTDSVITETRHEQIGEESKLYWRDNTRDFFANAVEACYLANDASKAFYFMEKSRAVLLNDKLNELGASSHLPAEEEAKQENFQINIIEQQQLLSSLKENSREYFLQQAKLLNAKDSFEHYIKSLEQNYPAYYQYKYADNVPSLQDLQKYLAAHNQSFVHYFLNDTVAYALAISKNTSRFIKLNTKDFNGKKLVDFLKLCSDKEKLNNDYTLFASSSNQLCQALFQPLQLAKGRVIICPDNFLIPFEALCDDKNGRHFLINDYAFSYVYSARYLMNPLQNAKAKGNFLGMAPVSFASNLSLPDLLLADDALQSSASHYNSSKLFTHEDASRSNFINFISDYSVVNIFSHAKADSSNEPLLYMQDSVIHLSELQLLNNNPATQLIVLSACQTNVGRNATGEGIYSLARGFAAAGIPSVAATLWKADDQMIYSISEKFHEYLSEGMEKDVALQKAKLYFMQHNNSDKLLPFYWSNMVLMGNAEPVKLTANSDEWLGITVSCLLLATVTFFMLRKRRKKFLSKN